MTKKQIMSALWAIEEKALAYEDAHGYDAGNNALLEVAHETAELLKFRGETYDYDLLSQSASNFLSQQEEASREAVETISVAINKLGKKKK